MARTRPNEVGSPSTSQLSLAAMLRMFVALVHSVVSTFQMKRNRPPRDWHTGPAHASLPRTKNDIQHQEKTPAIPQDGPIALMLRGREAIVSKHEGVLADQSEQHRDMPPPPSGGGATRTGRATSRLGWGTALTSSSRCQTVPHLDGARANACARLASATTQTNKTCRPAGTHTRVYCGGAAGAT